MEKGMGEDRSERGEGKGGNGMGRERLPIINQLILVTFDMHALVGDCW